MSILKLAAGALRRQTRPSIGVLLPACGSFGSADRAETFVMGILARYAGGYVGVAPLDLVFRSLSTPSISNFFQMIATLALRPQLLARLQSVTPQAPGSPPGTSQHTRPTRQAEPDRSTRIASRVIFERLFGRAQRTERLPLFQDDSPRAPDRSGEGLAEPGPAVERTPEGRPVPMTLRRAPSPIQHQDGAGRLSVVRADPPPAPSLPGGSSRLTRLPSPNVPLSPGDLGRLTDEVVQAIDRRIIAQRERRGVI